MSDKKYVDADFVRVRNQPGDTRTAFHLYFGDEVVIESVQNSWSKAVCQTALL